jgi:hypothetical protein
VLAEADECGKETLFRDCCEGDLRFVGDLFEDEDAAVESDRMERSRRGDMLLESVEDMDGPSEGREEKTRGRSGSGGSGSLLEGERRPLVLLLPCIEASDPLPPPPKKLEPSSAFVFGAELTRRRNRAAAEEDGVDDAAAAEDFVVPVVEFTAAGGGCEALPPPPPRTTPGPA